MRNSPTINRWLLYACIMSMVCVVIGACSSRPAPQRPRIEPTFDYEPIMAGAGRTAITFAVVGNEFEIPLIDLSQSGPGMTYDSPSIPLLGRFNTNMKEDFAEIITARGYTLRGPFETYDEMTFVDKENSDLVLNAKIDFDTISRIKVADWRKREGSAIIHRLSGQVQMSCRISLIIKESLTNERIWTKSVNISPIAVRVSPSVVYDQVYVTLVDILNRDNEFYTALGRRLDAQYDEILNRTYGYLDPREMAIIGKQAAELRKRKVY